MKALFVFSLRTVSAWLMIWTTAAVTVAGADAARDSRDAVLQPVLRLQPGGPTAEIFQLQFSRDGKTLYAAGRDKVIHVWALREASGDLPARFEYRPELVRRVAIAPGPWGNLDALAVSPDGRRVATGGYGAVPSLIADYRTAGFLYSSALDVLTPEQAEEQGLIYVFDATQTDRAVVLRGHRGPIAALTFVKIADRLRLVSAANEGSKDPHLVLRVWDVEAGRTLQVFEPPGPALSFSANAPHEMQAWTVNDQLHVALCGWDNAMPKFTERLHVFKLSKAKPELVERPIYAWVCRRPATESADSSLLVGTLPTTKSPARIAAWSESALLSLWEAPAGHTITDIQPLDVKRVAVILLDHRSREFDLVVRELGNPGATAASIHLVAWPNPRIAASRAGYLAVGASSLNEIEIVRLETGNRPTPQIHRVQRLAAGGEIFSELEFVTKDRQTGLRLSTRVDGRNQFEIVMNLSASRLEKDAAGWTSWAPDTTSLQLKDPVGTRRRLSVVDNGRAAVWDLPSVPSEGTITAQALCPKPQIDGLREIPLRAVAFDRHNGDTELNLYDARSGQRLRRYEGHSAVITGLAFSRDGRLLASCSKDRTVNLWWLSDLPQTIGKLGGLPNVRLRQVDEKSFVLASAPPASGLREGEAVLGFFERENGASRLRKFETVGDFLRAVAEHKPGEQIEIAQPDRRTAVTVGQAVDERKPLCSLFFKQDEKLAWSWAAWSPLGPFETSDERIEHDLGWHFNPRRADAPASFEEIGKYRNEFFGRGLLRRLIATGKVLDWPPTPELKVSLQFDAESKIAERNERGWTVRDKNLPFYVSVIADEIEPAITAVSVEVPGTATSVPLDRFDATRDLWSASLGKLIGRPGPVRLAATVTMKIAGRERSTAQLPLGEIRLQLPGAADANGPAVEPKRESETATSRSTDPSREVSTPRPVGNIPVAAPVKITILSPREPIEEGANGVPIVYTVTPKRLLSSTGVFLVSGNRELPLEMSQPMDNGDLRIVNVRLPEGPQTIRVRLMENGAAAGPFDETQVAILVRSARVHLDEIDWNDQDRTLVSRAIDHHFATVGPATVTLHGHVDWGDRPLGQREGVYVRIWVNAFLQGVEELKPPVGDRSSFDARLSLAAFRDNVIRAELVGAPQRESAPSLVDCRQPDRGQELHLIVVDCAKPTVNEEGGLVRQVREAFGVRTDAQGNEASKVFARVKLYPPCIGPQVDSNRVFAALVALKLKATQTGPANRVFLFYYRGSELRSSDGNSFILKTGDATRTNGVSSRYLARCFTKLKGAHLVFLDVEDADRNVAGADPWRALPPTLGLVRCINLKATEKTLAAYLNEAKSQALRGAASSQELTLLDVANWLRKRLQSRVDDSIAGSPVAMLHIIGN